MRGFRDGNLIIDQIRHLTKDQTGFDKRLPHIFTQRLADTGRKGDTPQVDWYVILQRYRLELLNGAHLVIQFVVQVLGILGR